MTPEKERIPNSIEKEKLAELAEELDVIQLQKTGGQGDVVMQKLLRLLRSGDAYYAQIFLNNEADKFSQYRKDAIPLIIEKLYSGSGSPWFTEERQLKAAKSPEVKK